MKYHLTLFFIIICLSCASQTMNETNKVVTFVEKSINQHVTFVGWEVENDSVKVKQITIYDFEKKTYIKFQEADVKLFYPNLFRGFTLQPNAPTSSSNGRNINDFNNINAVNFINRPYFYNTRPDFTIKVAPWELIS